jgi:uncharacterized Zn-finger protein
MDILEQETTFFNTGRDQPYLNENSFCLEPLLKTKPVEIVDINRNQCILKNNNIHVKRGKTYYSSPSKNHKFFLTTETISIQHIVRIEKDLKFSCNFPNCGKRFSSKWILQRHKNSHFDFNFYKCDQIGCNKTYKSKENLKIHIMNKHFNCKPFKCDFCEIKFSHRNGRFIFFKFYI